LKIRWTVPAVNQLEDIFDYISEENPAAAERTVRRIHEAILRTARMPRAGRIGRVPGTREVAVAGTPYLVAYDVIESMIHVLAILHGAQEWPESF
jgi:addiction module RelE/StbE family toxin